ncbi:iron-sulfur cluster carrier protein ApbC [Legionella jordanis]|uniref:Iron-sulfur cluster carrier protein n=1 Tax=Legionella jordanis TaxID=456 RepID=A0A0W0V8X0_9GAMM|nr:iron-sulfur cluster carrier protein ApbC [Legionella jordanis]KTD16532.1 ATPase [Legionella jordanis]RMX03926.1 iron-sulfur cluster carrier protein ApbC [Legionella jordanis]VEH12006.1 chromosome partitioning ATP-binding protein [Legionella jordanis]
MNIEDIIRESLVDTYEPLLQLSLQEMGLRYELAVNQQTIHLKLLAGFPSDWLEQTLLPILQSKLEKVLPNYLINISFDFFVKAHQTQMIGKGLKGVKNTIAIASGKGGVGKSTVAVNLAIALARSGAKVGLLDADIYGPSIPLMLGSAEPVAVANDQYVPVKAHGIQAMSIGYLTDSNEALIWRGPMLAKSLMQMLDLTKWDDLDYLIIDLPPGTGDIQLSLVQKIPLTGAIVVTTPQNVATLDAQKAIKMFEKTNIDVLGLVENMSMHTCSQCGHQEAIFGSGGAEELADTFKLPLLGKLPLDKRIQQETDEGNPTAAQNENKVAERFIQIALRAAIFLSQKPLNYAGKFPNIVVE